MGQTIKRNEAGMGLEELYKQKCNKKCDINEHLPTLKKYASLVNHVTEFGVRFGVSTVAFLAGKPKVLRSYDINKKSFKNYKIYKSLAKGTDFIFKVGDVLKIEIEKTDLLFIDTWHVYSQLKNELRLHADNVKKYIILHDTETFGVIGEDKKSPALLQAVNEFLKSNSNWVTEKVYKNNNGLYIMTNINN